ncbi:ParA family protein [Candidatus Fukatsuia endosymbiont of Tuberolachnus salignus]|uniref:ParA family protein n=1 Tax=Candidatus Fukatsuia endosymbiont of Tuberolachnus salignus TaxID=3077957 RepID=UPI00313EF8DA
MTKVISFANQKGGVGKSTLCIQEAFFLSMKKNKKVLVLDMDGQGNTTSRLAPRNESKDGSYEVILSGTKTAELFTSHKDNVEMMSCPCGVDLIHTPKNDPDLFEMEAMALDQVINSARHLKSLFAKYDFVLIDCPPSLGRKLVAALVMSTHVVCPVKLSGFAVDGVEGLLKTIINVQQVYNPDLNILGIVINDMDRSMNHDKALKVLQDTVPDFLFQNKIMHRSPIDIATTDGIPVWTLRYGHVAAKEIEAVLEEILEKVESNDVK